MVTASSLSRVLNGIAMSKAKMALSFRAVELVLTQIC